MRLIPVKCPPEPFEPVPPHNQTMMGNETLQAVILPQCGTGRGYDDGYDEYDGYDDEYD